MGLDVAQMVGGYDDGEAYDYDELVAETTAQPAGTPSSDGTWVMSPLWVTITVKGSPLFVDCRPGPRRGAVMKRHHGGGWSGPLWDSVADMWSETATTIEAADPALWPEYVSSTVGEWSFPCPG